MTGVPIPCSARARVFMHACLCVLCRLFVCLFCWLVSAPKVLTPASLHFLCACDDRSATVKLRFVSLQNAHTAGKRKRLSTASRLFAHGSFGNRVSCCSYVCICTSGVVFDAVCQPAPQLQQQKQQTQQQTQQQQQQQQKQPASDELQSTKARLRDFHENFSECESASVRVRTPEMSFSALSSSSWLTCVCVCACVGARV